MTSKTLTTEQPQVHAIAAADAALMRAGLPTHAGLMMDAAAGIASITAPTTRALAQLKEAERTNPTAASDTDYLHMQAFNVIIKKAGCSSIVRTVLAKNKDWALPTARRLLDTDPELAFDRFDSTVELSPVEAWKVHDWDKMDQRPEVFSSRVQALDCARFKGQGKFQIDELSRAVFYRDPDFKPEPAPAAPSDARTIPLPNVSPAELGTLLAALRFYQHRGMGKPEGRPNWLHLIATDGEVIQTGLDDAGIDTLFDHINK